MKKTFSKIQILKWHPIIFYSICFIIFLVSYILLQTPFKKFSVALFIIVNLVIYKLTVKKWWSIGTYYFYACIIILGSLSIYFFESMPHMVFALGFGTVLALINVISSSEDKEKFTLATRFIYTSLAYAVILIVIIIGSNKTYMTKGITFYIVFILAMLIFVFNFFSNVFLALKDYVLLKKRENIKKELSNLSLFSLVISFLIGLTILGSLIEVYTIHAINIPLAKEQLTAENNIFFYYLVILFYVIIFIISSLIFIGAVYYKIKKWRKDK